MLTCRTTPRSSSMASVELTIVSDRGRTAMRDASTISGAPA
jgi:hypothetical protein